MHVGNRSQARIRRTLLFFQHALDDGAAEASSLGYVPLPAPLVNQVKNAWTASYKGAARF
jgi:phosphate transport system substrate-binding protein